MYILSIWNIVVEFSIPNEYFLGVNILWREELKKRIIFLKIKK